MTRLRLALSRLGRRLRGSRAQSALTPTQWSLLSTVARRGRVGLSELARLEGIDAPALSRAVARLEQQGVARRRRDSDDRRAATVEATAAGRRLLSRVRADRDDVLRAGLAALGDDERRLLYAALPALETLAEALTRERVQR